MLTLASCNDWLDVQPSTQTNREKLFTTEEGFSEAIKGVYTQMSTPDLYGRWLTWGMLDVLAGHYPTNFGAPFNAARQYAYMRDGSWRDPTLANIVENFWSKLYNCIAGVNSILDKIDEQKDIFSGDNYTVLKGEAIGLRAFLHFEILRLYSDIYERSKSDTIMPYANRLTSLVAPELTGEVVIGEIIAELKAAIELLEEDPMLHGTTPDRILASSAVVSAGNNIHSWHNRRFRFNYYAAKATLARAYLWKGDKPNALATALEVIDAQATRFQWALTANVNAIANETSTLQDRTFATEHIFALNISNLDELIAGYQNNMAMSTGNHLYLNLGQFPSSDLGLDPRYLHLTANVVTQGRFPTKYWQNERVIAAFRGRMPIIRISEMYYIAAECSPNWVDGLTYLQRVRTNRNIGNTAITVNSDATLQTAIRDEYRKEFIAEGQLWHYYKRHQQSPPINMAVGDFGWRGVHLYVFPRPENEDLYRGNHN